MDSVSKLPQMKLNQSLGGKRQLPKWLAIVILIIVIGAILAGGLFLINRPQQVTSGLDPEAAADTRPLEITVWQPIREVVNTSTEVTVVSNKQITLEQHSRTTLQEVGELDGKRYYVAKVINLP